MLRFKASAGVCLFIANVCCAQTNPVGDVWRWIPFDANTSAKDAQIVRNSAYVSIKIQAAHVSYKSGFLENIKQVVVSSSVALNLNDKPVLGTNVNQTWAKSNNSEDSIPVFDLLAVLSPATPSSLSIKVNFAGIGQDRFKQIFDVLSNGDVKTALDLSPATLAKAGLVTSILQKFLASPYTSDKPKDILSMSQSFVIYPDRSELRQDALPEGYIVVISANENKNADLSKVLDTPSTGLRFDTTSHILQIQDGQNWHTFTGNSYVVFSVTTDTVRGIDENSTWEKKFSSAVQNTEKLLTGGTPETVKKDSEALWTEGVTLLEADTNYIEAERKQIRLQAFQNVQDGLRNNGGNAPAAALTLTTQGIPANFREVVADYQNALGRATLTGAIRVNALDAHGKPLANTMVRLVNQNDPRQAKTLATDSKGTIEFDSLKPGSYVVSSGAGDLGFRQAPSVEVKPTETKNLQVRISQQ